MRGERSTFYYSQSHHPIHQCGWKYVAAVIVLIFARAANSEQKEEAAGWNVILPGMELRWLSSEGKKEEGESRILIVRINPAKWQLMYVGITNTGDSTAKTARRWAEEHDLVAAINAGMYATDYKTPVGYAEFRGCVLSGKVNRYQSIAAFDPRDPKKAPFFRIFDLDQNGVTLGAIRREYSSLIQNLRLLKKPGENRWEQQDRKWSEAALGEDSTGNIMFVFCRIPCTMYDLNRTLLSAKIGLVALQHLEGGPQAQLFLHVGDVNLEMFGTLGTSDSEKEGNMTGWPIPNVLGIKRKK
jgi:hypothetical protein